jgi:hypothetical protein
VGAEAGAVEVEALEVEAVARPAEEEGAPEAERAAATVAGRSCRLHERDPAADPPAPPHMAPHSVGRPPTGHPSHHRHPGGR